MEVHYDSKNDLLYIRFEATEQQVTNVRVSDDIVLDLGEGERVVGIEVMDASKNINLSNLIPVQVSKAV